LKEVYKEEDGRMVSARIKILVDPIEEKAHLKQHEVGESKDQDRRSAFSAGYACTRVSYQVGLVARHKVGRDFTQ
ncbi:hypothetical protein KI387_039754, partial [Taxus chinensis]